MQQNQNEGFSYTYSAREQAEIKKIREKYENPTKIEDKMERLRRLDASVLKKAQIVSLTVGIIGTLILGIGMSLVMTDFGTWFGLREEILLVLGIVIGIVGFLVATLAYPIYNQTLKRERKRIAPEILRLTDELMK